MDDNNSGNINILDDSALDSLPAYMPEEKKKKPVKLFVILGICLVIAAGGGITAWQLLKPSQTDDEVTYKTYSVSQSDIRVSYEADGVISMPFGYVDAQYNAEIENIYVSVGDSFKEGDLLAELDDSSLNDAADSAKEGVQSAESSLRDAISSLNDAKANVTTVQLTVNEALDGVTDAENAVTEAIQAVKDAEDGVTDAEKAVRTAEDGVADAQASVTEAQDGVKDAQAAVKTAEYGVTDAQDAVKEAQDSVEDAKKSVTTAQRNLEKQEAAYATAVSNLEETKIKNENSLLTQRQTVADLKTQIQTLKDEIKLMEAFPDEYSANEVTSKKNSLAAQETKLKTEENNLALLERESADTTLTNAQEAVDDAKEQLEKAKANVTKAENNVTKAERNVETAITNVEKAKANVTKAETNVTKAQKNVETALENVEKAKESIPKAQNSVTKAENNVEKARNNVTKAQNNVTTARNNVTKAQENVTKAEENVAKAEQTLEKAEETLDEAIANLSNSKLYAPCDGEVVAVNKTVGETAAAVAYGNGSTTASFIVYQTDDTLYKATASIPELDIGEVFVGQSAEITIDAVGTNVYTGTLTSLSKFASAGSNNVVSYQAIVSFDPGSDEILDQMNCSITYITKEVKDVLNVPNDVIYVENGKSYVKVRNSDGTEEARAVTTGFSDGSVCEIKSGLSRGETVVSQTATNSISSSNNSNNQQQGGEMSFGGNVVNIMPGGGSAMTFRAG